MSRRDWIRKVEALTALLGIVAGISACGGASKDDPCGSLKIAGGNQCEVRPLAVAAVLSDLGYCSGAFLSKRHLVTAAHCIPEAGAELTVVTKGFSATTRTAVRHPGFRPGGISPNDVAVITLPTDAPIEPVPLLESRQVEKGDSVIAFGYGLDEDGNDVLGRVQGGGLPLKATYLDVFAVTPESVRTISDGGGDTCRGDSGGPLVMRGDNGQFGVVAVVSFGPNTCVPDNGLPSDNTNLQATTIREFIEQNVAGVETN